MFNDSREFLREIVLEHRPGFILLVVLQDNRQITLAKEVKDRLNDNTSEVRIRYIFY